MNPLRLALLAGLVWPLAAAESFRDFSSRIEVLPDASLHVTELLFVHAEGNQIRHGIYRDFPTQYRTTLGLRSTTSFEVLRVLRDGRPEPWHGEPRANGTRVYLGDAATNVPPGDHTYTLEYRTERQLGFFRDHDELFWNVTGNGGALPIEHAEAEVRLPRGAVIQRVNAYTGVRGSRARDATAEATEPTIARFATTRPLRPGEGFTLLVTWPKGVIADDHAARLSALLWENEALLLSLGLTFLVLAYVLLFWATRVRRRTSIPQVRSEPPPGLSPAAIRYLYRGGYDRRCFAANVVSLATKGALRITQTGRGFAVERAQPVPGLPRDERVLRERLFAGGDRLEFAAAEAHRVRPANDALKCALADVAAPLLDRNRGAWAAGVVLNILAIGTAIRSASDVPSGVFITVVTVPAVLFAAAVARRGFRSGSGEAIVGRSVLTLSALLLLALLAWGIGLGPATGTAWVAVITAVNVLLAVVSYHAFRSPTVAGRAVFDQLDDFRRHLVEKPARGTRGAGALASDAFARMLPYAIALGTEKTWGRRFETVVGAEDATGDFDWYDGRWNHPSGFATTLGGSMAAAISASCSPPGTSSGDSGGGGGDGGSGGGGGGGGSGGW